jgi:two-component system, LytTR family, sensor histidine kinase AlgZ
VHPILANRERLFLYLAAWLPMGLLLSAILARGSEMSWTEAVAVALPMCLMYSFMCLGSWYITRSRLQDRTTWMTVVMLTAAALFYSSVWALLGRTWADALELIPNFAGLANRYTSQAALLFLTGVLLFLLATAVHYLLLTLEEAQTVEKRALALQVLAREAELRALRAQIDPHFLFNSLNSISALTVSDAKAARRMCLLLSDFMRTSLAVGSRAHIPLSEELKISQGFLDIEKVRFGDRLDVRFTVDAGCRDCLVPPLLIQPLIENAVTHGIAPMVEGGSISIEARQDAGAVQIVIDNPYDSESTRQAGTGVGMRNVRERLRNLFAESARLDVVQDGRHFRVGLRFPCVRSRDAPGGQTS